MPTMVNSMAGLSAVPLKPRQIVNHWVHTEVQQRSGLTGIGRLMLADPLQVEEPVTLTGPSAIAVPRLG